MCVCTSPQARLQPRHMNMAPLVSFGQFWFWFVFVCVEIELNPPNLSHPPFPLQLTTAAHSVQRPSPTVPHQLTTIMDTQVCANMDTLYLIFFKPNTASLCRLSPHPGLQLPSCEQHGSLTGFLFLFIRTGAFQTSPNPQSPSQHSHPHW